MSGEELLPQRSGDSLAVHKARLFRKQAQDDDDDEETEEIESQAEDMKTTPRIDSVALARGRLSINTGADSPSSSAEESLSRKSGGLKAPKAAKPPKPKSPKKQGARTRFADDSAESDSEKSTSLSGTLSNVGRKLAETFTFGKSRSSSISRSEDKPHTQDPEPVEISAESTHVKFGDVTLCDDVVEHPKDRPDAGASQVELNEKQVLLGHTDRVWSVAWSPAGDLLATCAGDKTVRIWVEASQGGEWRCVAVLEDSHSRTVRSCAWAPGGRQLATASFDATTAIWQREGQEWEQAAVLEGHENEVKSVAWSPSGMLVATCSRDKSVWLWESLPGNEFECVDVKQGHSQDVKMVAWHPDGDVLASASYDDTIKLWIESDDEWICAQTLIGHESTVWAIAFNAGGSHMVSCSADTTLRVWNCQSNAAGDPSWKLATTITGYHTRPVYSVDWSPEGVIVTGSGTAMTSTLKVVVGSFDLQAAKTRAERNYGASTPPSFKRFTYTETADKLLLGLVKFFHAQFRHVSLAVALDKARRQHLEGVKPDVVTATIGDLHAEELRHKLELGPVYCAVVLQCSNFRNTVKDKLFFEAFQSFTTDVLCEAFNANRWRDRLEIQLGEMFRTSPFNSVRRKQLPGTSPDTLKLKELFKMKYEKQDGNSEGKLVVTSRRDFRVNVQKASTTRTSLVESVIWDLPPIGAPPGPKRTRGTHTGPRRKRSTPQPTMSPLPVHVLPNGLVSDDALRELDLLQSALAAAAAASRDVDSQRSLFVSSSFSKPPLAM
ncbi:hypothetical protein WJX84_004631 [Apatococcus fuscideae]|uniref:Probable cytosolic iron-sulfur protein assembly protein CIAO1 homolog n=1 Tax=Apatococcus fuscideae TaxID=2026836 RepID=A0AAW1SSR9_9CHLO